ncbi:MAG: hypothetical protein AB1847_10360 [bacterium]
MTKKYQVSILLLLFTSILLACAQQVNPRPDKFGCMRPPVVKSSDIDFKIAELTANEVAISGIDMKTITKVTSLASQIANDAQAKDYLRCLAIHRDGYTRKQAVYIVDDFMAFMKTEPTAKEFLVWKKDNPFPTEVKEEALPDDEQKVTQSTAGGQSPAIYAPQGGVSVTYGVSQEVIDRILKIFDEREMAQKEREGKLQELAQKYKELLEEGNLEGAEKFLDILEEGNLEGAEKFLDIPGEVVFDFKVYKTLHFDKKVKKVKFLPNARAVAIIYDYSIEIIEINSENQLSKYEKIDEKISSTDFSKGNDLVAVGFDSNLLYIYTQNGHLQKKLKGERSSVTSVAFNREGSLLAVGFKDGHIELIDTGRWKIVGKLKGHIKQVHSLGFTPNNKRLVSVSDDLQTKFWDLNVKKEKKSLIDQDRLFSTCFSPDGSLMGSNIKEIIIDYNSRNRRIDNRFLVVRKTTTGDEVKRFILPKDISAIAFYNKRYIASASEDNIIQIWDIYNGIEASVLALEGPTVSLDFSNDGKMLVYASHNEVIIYKQN